MTVENERWVAIPGYEDAYAVSDLGRVKSLARRVRLWTPNAGELTRSVAERILRPGPQKSGHLSVALGKGNSKQVHQLVLLAFEGPRPEGLEVLHRDGDPSNNRLSNLRYGTRSENLEDIFYHTGRKLSREQVLYLRKRAEEGFYYGERYRLSLGWGVNPSTVWSAAEGKNYTHVK